MGFDGFPRNCTWPHKLKADTISDILLRSAPQLQTQSIWIFVKAALEKTLQPEFCHSGYILWKLQLVKSFQCFLLFKVGLFVKIIQVVIQIFWLSFILYKMYNYLLFFCIQFYTCLQRISCIVYSSKLKCIDSLFLYLCCDVGPEPKPKLRGDNRTFRVWLDPNQYQQDMTSSIQNGTEDPYETFNIIMRRKPKENNFKVRSSLRFLYTSSPS